MIMKTIFAFLFLLAITANASNAVDNDLIEREKLAFIERSIVQIYKQGTFPEIFDTKIDKLQACGCRYGTQPIFWGSLMGMMCKLMDSGFSEECGQRCTTPKGQDILLLCPPDWETDCFRGCVPPSFNTVQDRYDFLERNVKAILDHGHDYLMIDSTYLEECKCVNGKANIINYGTKIGYDCIVDGQPGENCSGFGACENHEGKRIMVFCPAGHSPSCDGCKSTIDNVSGYDADLRYEWSINVLTGYIRESQRVLNIQPLQNDVINCGCQGSLQEVDYGNRIGFYCKVDPDVMSPECSNRLICRDAKDEDLIHFCPEGFVSDCEKGCGYWWTGKDEL